MAKKQKLNVTAILAAAGSGAGYNLALDMAAPKVPFISNNYMVAKSAGATLLGAGLLYFGNGSEEMKAAAYGLLGVGGAAAGSKVATMVGNSTGSGMNGKNTSETLKNILTKLNAKKKIGNPKQLPSFLTAAARMAQQQPAVRQAAVQNLANAALYHSIYS